VSILFIDSFAYGDALHQIGRFTPFFPSCKYISYVGGNFPDTIVSGPAGEIALEFGSSGFNQHTLTKVFGTLTTVCLGFLYRPFGIAATGVSLCRYEAGGTTIVNPGGFDNGGNANTSLMLQQNPDGTLSLYSGGLGIPGNPGTLLYTTTYTVLVNQWLYIELLIDTVAGSWSLYIDDVFIQSQTGLTLPGPTTQFSLQSFSFESHDVANLYCTSGERLGPCRAIGFPPVLASTNQWNPLNPPNLSQISEFGNRPFPANTPDDNLSYIDASSAGLTDFYGFTAPACFGRILALALNADGSAQTGSPSIDFLIKILGATYPSGTTGAYLSGYSIQQGLTQLNPATGTFWNDADIGNALLGFSLAGGGDLRVTQFFGEKLVSLRSVPFDCGKGNRSYSN
jgi:hypothetical protein